MSPSYVSSSHIYVTYKSGLCACVCVVRVRGSIMYWDGGRHKRKRPTSVGEHGGIGGDARWTTDGEEGRRLTQVCTAEPGSMVLRDS